MNPYFIKQSSIIVKILEITKETPNDQELGKKIRSLITEYEAFDKDYLENLNTNK
jgi:hypothetical protein